MRPASDLVNSARTAPAEHDSAVVNCVIAKQCIGDDMHKLFVEGRALLGQWIPWHRTRKLRHRAGIETKHNW